MKRSGGSGNRNEGMREREGARQRERESQRKVVRE